jgi:predicted transcriptional regulator
VRGPNGTVCDTMSGMALTLSFPPELEAKLRQRAAAEGKDPETLVREAVEQKLGAEQASPAHAKGFDEWRAEFEAWVAGHPPVEHEVDDSRESIYRGRGE